MFDAILRSCAAVAGAILAAIVAGIAVNVVLRNLFGAPLHGLLDLVEYGLLLVTCLGAPWVLSQSAHVVVDLVTGALPDAAARVAARIVACIGCVVSLAMVWYGTTAMMASQARGSMIRTAIDVPEWWVLSVLPAAFVLIAAEFLRQILRPRLRHDAKAGL
ncbi:TRAP transporter small permease [Sulfitobacter sp. D35]|uniref:TRAP transporter small permease n=1 Tax=Sulfitobacter sp. D35 TaxID=3083252 RepID=UPI00296E874E|nr:TRAP transporter small permease [Sulfitobacter sp. D35]MDW4500344.1 TRAP transporter small permease [Sulfitobacter sp. D35]